MDCACTICAATCNPAIIPPQSSAILVSVDGAMVRQTRRTEMSGRILQAVASQVSHSDTKSEAAWQTIDTTTLKSHLRKLYDAIGDARSAFEDAMIADARHEKQIVPGESLTFGYRFGKLSVQIVAEKAKALGAVAWGSLRR